MPHKPLSMMYIFIAAAFILLSAFVFTAVRAQAYKPAPADTDISRTPLMDAISRQDYKAAKSLLEQGGDPNQDLGNGETPMTMVAAADDTRWLDLLLSHGGNPDAVNAIGEPLLVNAALHRNMGAIRILLDRGATLEKRAENGDTVILTLARLNQFQYVYELLERGADATHVSPVSEDSAAYYIFHSELDPANDLAAWQKKCQDYLKGRGIEAPPPKL